MTAWGISSPELQARGWEGSVHAVRRYVRPFRQPRPCPRPAKSPAGCSPARPSGRGEQAQLDAIRARCPHLDALAGHVTSFAEMMTRPSGPQELEGWLAAAEADDQPHLHFFAAGIHRDLQAVTAGLTLPYSSGAVEGNVNRIKMIKRQSSAAPASACSASASSSTPGNHGHGSRVRAHNHLSRHHTWVTSQKHDPG